MARRSSPGKNNQAEAGWNVVEGAVHWEVVRCATCGTYRIPYVPALGDSTGVCIRAHRHPDGPPCPVSAVTSWHGETLLIPQTVPRRGWAAYLADHPGGVAPRHRRRR
ncbi:hypothetical protein Dgeo_2978 (plasmid) [Deinococcus geothermalis DSM 11300]|uniref:Uncharacterized protein n=1 Tax=Deinococcus geothermalis (strain DSM 11300 / CIP 105573 / AG-3a) TaxID=319795 RepID=A8ZRB2_DEIGD|nr:MULTISPECIES: hypothetical protein [Deinococcus]ABW35021.1 hypothetical protein Dgeo_2978 [Deinococcus geothermalis DSM 11300]TDE84771.1 hypothetical protein E0686_15340 [Deinococcus sp. S9]